jgi:hypothetical protein
VPTHRVKLTTVSHDLPRVQPRAQQGAPPRPTPGLGLSLSLGRNRELRLARPQASASASASGATGSSASLDPRPRPQPRPRRNHRLARPRASSSEESPPRPTSASDRLHHRGYIITLPLASCLRLRRNKTGVPSRLLWQQVMMVPSMHP